MSPHQVMDDEKKLGENGEIDKRRSSRRFSTYVTANDASTVRVPLNDVFAWLGWGPSPKSPCGTTLAKLFPGALPGPAIQKRTVDLLGPFGMTPENTIYGQSICPDEINNEEGDLANLMARYWGECFAMGGIGGAPFVGKTGFAAFSNHVPDDGHVIILFGPHIAISESGELGKYLRTGQKNESTACGAVLAAYDSCMSGDDFEFDINDMQQCWIREKITAAMPRIKADKEPLKALIYSAYEAVKDNMMDIANTDLISGKLVLLGGIQLNMPRPMEDFFMPLMFQVTSRDNEAVDLLPKLFYTAQDEIALPHAVHASPDSVPSNDHIPLHDVFAWLNWGPKMDTPCGRTLARCFPDALPGKAIHRRTADLLRPHGMEPENTIYGQSICPDEINNEEGDLANLMATYWGECFSMGGIGGAPFVGKTGFAAFSTHVPDDGHVIILFGPHIAISESGELGKYLRTGQKNESTACGAVLAAYDSCKSGDDFEFDINDMQQCWLREKLTAVMPRVMEDEEPLQALIFAAYEAVKENILDIVNCKFGTGKVVLLGGIQLNMPKQYEDHFVPLLFQMMSGDGETTDMLPQLWHTKEDEERQIDVL